MCFHTREEMEEFEKRWQADPNNHKGFVIMRDAETRAFEEAYHCDVTDEQAISNTIRNLRAWHPGGHIVDLDGVNTLRRQLGLSRIREAILPPPTGEAPPSEDPNASVKEEATWSSWNTTGHYSFSNTSGIDFATIERQIIEFRRAADVIVDDLVDDLIVEYTPATKTGRVRSGMSTQDWWERQQRRQKKDIEAWYERYAMAAKTVMLTPMPPILLNEIRVDEWSPLVIPFKKEKRIFAKTDNWIERFMREHKYREDEEVKRALAA